MSGEPNLAQLLLHGFRWFDEALRTSLVAAGWPPISSAQSLVFANLDVNGTSTSELARRIGVTRQAVQQVVAGAAEQGLVELVPDAHDRRARLVQLTEDGRRNVASAQAILEQLELELRRRVGEHDVDQLRRSLGRKWGEPPVVAAQVTKSVRS